MEYVEFCVNLWGLFCKVKYYWMIDSEIVLWGKGEKNFGRGVKRIWNCKFISSRRMIKMFDYVFVEEWVGDL